MSRRRPRAPSRSRSRDEAWATHGIAPPPPDDLTAVPPSGHGSAASHVHRSIPLRRPALRARLRSISTYPWRMKYVVLVPDGCADEPLAELGGRTPLEAAHMPHLARLAATAEVGLAEVIPPGLPPGSDVGNLAILGYDPAEFHTGRAPIEAAAMGVELAPDEVAFRCNLVTVGDDGTMVDFAAGHVSSAQSHPIVAALDAALGDGRDGVRFHPGVEYRHLV